MPDNSPGPTVQDIREVCGRRCFLPFALMRRPSLTSLRSRSRSPALPSPSKRLHQRRLPSSCAKPHAAFDPPPEKRPNRSLSGASFTQFPRSSQKLSMFSTAPWTLLSSKFAGFGRSRLQRVFKRVDKRLTLTDTTIQAQSPTARCSEL